MSKEAIEILLKIKAKITDDSDLAGISFETADDLRKEIDGLVSQVRRGDEEVCKNIQFHFLPTSTFQEHAIQNGWEDEYLQLAERFDQICQR